MYKINLFFVFSLLFFAQIIEAQVITKSGPATADVAAGEIFTYTVNYTCPSTVAGDCDNVVITDVLPSGLEYINATVGSTYDTNAGEVELNLGTVPNGATRSLDINVRFLSGTIDGTQVINTATVNYTQVGAQSETSNPVTTTATNGIVINFSDNLQIVKNSNGSLVDGLDYRLKYKIEYGSESSSPQTGFVIEDILPTGMLLYEINFLNNDICTPAIPYEFYVQIIDKNTGVTSWELFYTDFDGGTYSCNEPCDFSSLGLTPDQYVNGARVVFTGTIPGDGCFNQNNPAVDLSLELLVEYDEAITGIPLPALGDTISNCATVNSNELTLVQDCQEKTVESPEARGTTSKQDRTNTSPYEPGEVVEFRISGGNLLSSSIPFLNPTFIDILPPEMEYIGVTSISFAGDYNINAGSTSDQPLITSEILPDGSTKITYTWDDALGNGVTLISDNSNSIIRVDYEVRVRASAPDMATLTNEFYASYETPLNSCTGSFVDVDDIDGDGDVTELLCNSNLNVGILYPPGFAGLNSYKEVQGNLDSAYSRFPSSGQVTPNGNINYNICLENPANLTEPINDIVLVDVLPHIGDMGVVANNEFRLSEWRPVFTATTIADLNANLPAGSIVYYSTECMPCLNGDLGVTNNPGCTTPAWSTVPPIDPTTVCAFKIEFPPSYTLNPGDAPTCFEYNMQAPSDVPTNGEIAWNSFGYVGQKSDNSSLLASEPIKVGIASFSNTCSITDTGKTIETCNDNGTTSDPADDYITFSLNPMGSGIGATYSVTADAGGTVTLASGGAATGISYGSATAFRLQNGSADGSTTYTITVTDVDDNTCQVSTTVLQNSCSGACNLTDTGKTLETCNANGTTSDPVDDYITFSLNPVGSGIGATYSVTADAGGTVTLASGGAATGISYGSATAFRLQNGSADGSTTYTITVTDVDDNTCQVSTTVLQSSCSDACQMTGISATAETCNDNGTGPDPADDYISFSLNPTGINLGATYSVTADAGGLVTRASGGAATGISYGTATAFRLQNGSANGTLYTITVTDEGDASCSLTTTLQQSDCAVAVYSLGNRVFYDDDNSGTQDAGEGGVAGVTLQLLNADGSVYDSDTSTTGIQPLTVTTTNEGYYRFDELLEGSYIVEVVASSFGSGAILETYVSSDGTGEELNPNNDVDLNDNGIDPATSGAVRSGIITLGGVEPLGEQEPASYTAGSFTGAAAADSESNLTVDFGFYRQRDRPDYDDPDRSPCGEEPCHFVSNDIYLGSGVTADSGSQGSSTADADIDDGIALNDRIQLTPGSTIRLPVTFYNVTGQDAYLRGWVDWNGDGDFDDAGEQAADLVYLAAVYTGSFTEYVNISIPVDAQKDNDIATRWRISTDDTNSNDPCGNGSCANDGEIEDYLLRVTCPTALCPVTTINLVRN